MPSNRRKVLASYDVVSPKGRRTGDKRFRLVASEAADVTPSKAAEMTANAHDAVQNMALASWMLKTHLDHTTGFTPQAHTPSEELNAYIEQRIARASLPENFSASGLLSRQNALRCLEAACVIDGDGAWAVLDDGTVQGLEGSRICLPGSGDNRNVGEYAAFDRDGIRRNKQTGRHLEYCVCRYDLDSKMMVFDAFLPAEPVIYSWWNRRFDQLRGVSPLASCLITLRDLYSGMAYTLLKMRLHAMMGVVIVREGGGVVGGTEAGALGLQTTTETEDSEGNTVTQVDVDLKDGIAMFDMDPGEDVKFLDSDTPSPNIDAYHQSQIRLALKALDIPYSMFDPKGSNHAQRKADAMQYVESLGWRRDEMRNVLRRWLAHMSALWASEDREWRRAIGAAGMMPADVADVVAWEPHGIASLAQPDAAEIAQRIALGQTTYQAEAAKWGGDFMANVRDIGAALAYAAEHGAPISAGAPGQAFAGQTGTEPEPEQNEDEPENEEPNDGQTDQAE